MWKVENRMKVEKGKGTKRWNPGLESHWAVLSMGQEGEKTWLAFWVPCPDLSAGLMQLRGKSKQPQARCAFSQWWQLLQTPRKVRMVFSIVLWCFQGSNFFWEMIKTCLAAVQIHCLMLSFATGGRIVFSSLTAIWMLLHLAVPVTYIQG